MPQEPVCVATAMKPFQLLKKIVEVAGIHLAIIRRDRHGIDYETPDGRLRLVCAVEDAPDPTDVSGWELNIHLMLQDENEVFVSANWDQEAARWHLFWDSCCEGDDVEPWLNAVIASHGLGDAGTGRTVADDVAETFIRDCARTYLDTLN